MSAFHPRCPVCGDPLSGNTVSCPECETPHHADCWSFGGACSIYGCHKSASHDDAPADPTALSPEDRLRGGVFGALLGVGVTTIVWPVLSYTAMGPRTASDLFVPGLAWALCAAVLGWQTGSTVRGRVDRGRTLWLALIGPAWTAFRLAALAFAVVYFPFFLMFSLPAVLVALPCALAAERFNQASAGEHALQGRMMRWAALALALGACVCAVVALKL